MTFLWDYLHGPGRNEMVAWAKQEKLSVRERAQLNQKLDILSRLDLEQAFHMEFLKGTSGDCNHIYKLIVKSQRMLRPMLCRGHVEPHEEVTLLCGAIEKDFKLHPRDAAERAEQHRQSLIQQGGKGRTIHERF